MVNVVALMLALRSFRYRAVTRPHFPDQQFDNDAALEIEMCIHTLVSLGLNLMKEHGFRFIPADGNLISLARTGFVMSGCDDDMDGRIQDNQWDDFRKRLLPKLTALPAPGREEGRFVPGYQWQYYDKSYPPEDWVQFTRIYDEGGSFCSFDITRASKNNESWVDYRFVFDELDFSKIPYEPIRVGRRSNLTIDLQMPPRWMHEKMLTARYGPHWTQPLTAVDEQGVCHYVGSLSATYMSAWGFIMTCWNCGNPLGGVELFFIVAISGTAIMVILASGLCYLVYKLVKHKIKRENSALIGLTAVCDTVELTTMQLSDRVSCCLLGGWVLGLTLMFHINN